VSSAVRNLEHEFGVPLFERTTHHVALTGAGQLLLPEARRTLAAAASARDVVAQAHGGLRGTVRLGIMQHEPSFSAAQLVAEFRAEHPQVEIELHRGSSTTHATDLRRGRIDVAVLALTGWPGLTLTELRRQRMRLVCPAGHRLAERTRVVLSDLAAESFAEGPPDWATRIANDRAFSDAGVPRRIAYEVADVSTVLDLVRHALAVAIVPPSVVGPDPALRVVGIHPRPPLFITSIAVADQHEPGAPARALVRAAQAMATTVPSKR
jgi:DNA-binding transcriptional LysR family regulator